MSGRLDEPVILTAIPTNSFSGVKGVIKVNPSQFIGVPVTSRQFIVSNVEDVSDDEYSEKRPARKRQKLDHLSPEEKLQRRKLKNRVAAQTARDRKKARMDDLEVTVNQFEKEIDKLKTENELLWKLNANLKTENETLKVELEKTKILAATAAAAPPPPPVKEEPRTCACAELKTEKPFDPAEGTGLSVGGPREAQGLHEPPVVLDLGAGLLDDDELDVDVGVASGVGTGVDLADVVAAAVAEEQFNDGAQSWEQILAELATVLPADEDARTAGKACKGIEADIGAETNRTSEEEKVVFCASPKSDHVYACPRINIPIPSRPEANKPRRPTLPNQRPVIRIQLPEGCTTLDLSVPGALEHLLRATFLPKNEDPDPAPVSLSLPLPLEEEVASDLGLDDSPYTLESDPGYESTSSPHSEDGHTLLPTDVDMCDAFSSESLLDGTEFARDSFPWSDDLKFGVWDD